MPAYNTETANARQLIASAVQALVDVLDRFDGDADHEDATGAEDAFEDHEERVGYSGPGCSASDEGEHAWPEWHTRGRHKDLPPRSLPDEDAEDDSEDRGFDEGEPDFRILKTHLSGPGCSISDPDSGIEDQPEGTPGLDYS